MKKLVLLITLITIIFTMSSCGSTSESPLETRIKEFDYYTEIVDFVGHYKHIKLLAAYNDSSTEVTYIYFMDEVQGDYEILFYIGEENLIYEDFVVLDYIEDGYFIGEFTGSSLELEEDVTKVNFRITPPGGGYWNKYTQADFTQEFFMITSTNDIADLHRDFVATSEFTDTTIVFGDVNVVGNRTMIAFWISLVSGVILYFVLLQGYKKIYTKVLQHKLDNPNEKQVKLPDLQVYKYTSAFVVLILIIVSSVISSNIISGNYETVEFYKQYGVTYDQLSSNDICVEMGATYDREVNVAQVHKCGQHRIMGHMFVTLDDGTMAYVPTGSFGGQKATITYRYIQAEYLTLEVKNVSEDLLNELDEDSHFFEYLETVLERKLYFDQYRR